jgi:hypothetical protein
MDIQQALTDAVAASMATIEQPPAPQVAAEPQDVDPQDPPTDDTPDTPETPEADPAPDEDAADEATDAPVLPEGYVAVPVVADQLATEFVLRDAEGEVEIPALIVEYKANGKVRQDRLDQVVKLAQFGVYNEAREQQFKQAESRLEELESVVEQREAQLERILRDEDFFLAVREAYEAENSPERRAERAEQMAQQARLDAQMQPILQQGAMFYEREVSPALDLIAQTFPAVTPEELSNRMAYAMQLHVETAPNGATYIPPSQYDAVRQYIVDDLAFWAQSQQARRVPAATAPAQQAALQNELAKAQVSAQKAKRAVGQATKPVGRAASNTPAKPKVAKPATVDDALDSAMSEILASIR